MTGPRILQNFSGCRGHLVAADPRVAEPLGVTLGRLGVELVIVPLDGGCASLDLPAMREDRDILFVDADLDQPLGAEAVPAVPVIGLIGVEAPSRLKALMQIGATAFLHKPIHGAVVYSALFLGINGFMRRRHLYGRIDEHERRRRARRFVIKATIDLMQRTGINEDQAYAILRRESMRHRVSIEEYSATLVEAKDGSDAVRNDNADGLRSAIE
jgi:AmiR/NasT family two-component response regulator